MYDYSSEQVKAVLDVWQIIELLNPTSNETLEDYLAKARTIYKNGRLEFINLHNSERLFLQQNNPFQKYAHDKSIEYEDYEAHVFWHIYIKYLNWTKAEAAIRKKLDEIFGKDSTGFINQNSLKPTVFPIAAFLLNKDFTFEPNSLMISNSAWSLGRIMKLDHKNPNLELLFNFSGEVNQLKTTIIDKYIGRAVTLDDIEEISEILLTSLEIDPCFLVNDPDLCIRKISYEYKGLKNKPKVQPKSSLKANELEMFNSYFLKDIDLVKNNIQNLQKDSVLSAYLGMNSKPQAIDLIQDRQALIELTRPTKMPLTRWPSSPRSPLVLLQSAAINAISANYLKDQKQIFAINGPPGTGKTTTLFDLIANIYVKRAQVLSELEQPKSGFQSAHIGCESGKYVYKIWPTIDALQKHGIVIASSNNNAVQNISKALPQLSKIDPIYRSQLKYFEHIKSVEEIWGMFAASLGNATNNRAFIKDFCSDLTTYLEDLNDSFYLSADKKSEYSFPGYCTSQHNILVAWQQAQQEFKEVEHSIQQIYQTIERAVALDIQKNQMIKHRDLLEDYRNQYKVLDVEYTSYKLEYELLKAEIDALSLGWMGILHKIFNTEKYKTYSQDKNRLKDHRNQKSNAIILVAGKMRDTNALIEKTEGIVSELARIEQALLNLEIWLDAQGLDSKQLIKYDWSKVPEELHKSLPYFDPKLEELKSQLFIKAIKLHEVFIHANVDYFRRSIKLSASTNMGQTCTSNVRGMKAAWSNLFMIVPVVSTTFHSLDKLLGHFSREEIGWLIIDEAGQAPPQNALGGLYRASNVVIVGDPMQTEPISLLGPQLIKQLFDRFESTQKECSSLPMWELWSPAHSVSVQSLADRVSAYQTHYSERVVGFPLIVHRRCHDPMFSICNQISYGGQMVYAVKEQKSVITEILGRSRWIDVQDEELADHHHVSVAEFNKLIEMLELVAANNSNLLSQIYVITMYKKFKEYIYRNLSHNSLFSSFCKTNIGTIHTFQGKENDTVVLMLGAQDPQALGARNSMTREPNILNVGISRAQRNLYVIGNKELWKPHRYMLTIIRELEKYAAG